MIARVVWMLCVSAFVCAFCVAGQAQQGSALTLPQALQRAASVSPRLTAADHTIGMAEGRRDQAGVLPNPTLGF